MSFDPRCMDCDVDTFDIDEFYMLDDAVWAQVHDQYEGMLCIGCAEARLGRTLRAADFNGYPINTAADRPRSDRLRSRLDNKEKTMSQSITITLTPTQAEAMRVLAGEDPSLEKVIASRPTTTTHMLVRITNKTQARNVTKHMDRMIANLTDAERTGPSMKMAYALERHVDEIKATFG